MHDQPRWGDSGSLRHEGDGHIARLDWQRLMRLKLGKIFVNHKFHENPEPIGALYFQRRGLAKPDGSCHGAAMFRKTLPAICSVFLAFSTAAFCQTNPVADDTAAPDSTKTSDTATPNRFWQATLAGGNYMVALDRIVSVSRHKYVLDGAVIVDEVNVDTTGQALVRFYFISPITDGVRANAATQLADRGKELLDKAAQRGGTDIPNMVVKKYPETTHAKIVEYRLLSESDLTSLYGSVRNAWESGKGRKFATATK